MLHWQEFKTLHGMHWATTAAMAMERARKIKNGKYYHMSLSETVHYARVCWKTARKHG